jgi:hypothetical protein
MDNRRYAVAAPTSVLDSYMGLPSQRIGYVPMSALPPEADIERRTYTDQTPVSA